MKFNTILSLFLTACLLGTGTSVMAQDQGSVPAEGASSEAEAIIADAEKAGPEEILEWSDYSVKAYTLTIWGGGFGGTTYLENQPLGARTVLTDGAADIIAYDGGVLFESKDTRHYDAATKEIESGNSYGGRVGIYIADDFHLDLMASFASGEAVTTMLFTEDPDLAPDKSERVVVDTDPDFKTVKGGLALMYNANRAKIFGMVPRLGFGIGGVINRYSQLEDKTALYLEGNLGLNYEVLENLEIGAQVDFTNFAFEVDELGYSNMVSYTTYSLGLTWFIDRVPAQVRAAHYADRN